MDRLPLDNVRHIFAFLDAVELSQLVGGVSRAFRRAATTELLWADLLDRSGIRSFMHRLDRRARVRAAVGRDTPTQAWDAKVAALRMFFSPAASAAAGTAASSQALGSAAGHPAEGPVPGRIATSYQAFLAFADAFGAGPLLRTPHRCCPFGSHPEAITDDVSRAVLAACPSLFGLYEQLWRMLEEWMLRNGLLLMYLAVGLPGVDMTGAMVRAAAGNVPPSLAAAFLVAGGGQVEPPDDAAPLRWDAAADDPSVRDVAGLLRAAPAIVVSAPNQACLALFGVCVFYNEAIINVFAPDWMLPRTLLIQGWDVEVMAMVRGTYQNTVAAVTSVTRNTRVPPNASSARPLYDVGHIVHVSNHPRSRNQPLLGLSPNFETYVFQWVRDVCVLQRFDFDPQLSGISRFPRYGGGGGGGDSGTVGQLHGTSIAVTFGVEVSMAAVLIPHRSGGTNGFAYAYRCQMRLLPSSPFPSVQLTHRRWKITNLTTLASEVVEGEGVIGLTPTLVRMTSEEAQATSGDCGLPRTQLHKRPSSDKVFDYCSMTTFPVPHGVMEGHFRFVPGTSDVPYGEAFFAAVAPFSCCYNEAERLMFGEW